MIAQALPLIRTDRLLLRPFDLADAGIVQRLAGDFEVAKTSLTIPHPYADGVAATWIVDHDANFERGLSLTLAIIMSAPSQLIGAISLRMEKRFSHAEMGYWIGRPYWNMGYATEAGRAVVDYGFRTLGLHRIFAHHMVRNPASGRVMQKLGMQYEGCMREHGMRWEKFEDLALYGILSSEYKAPMS